MTDHVTIDPADMPSVGDRLRLAREAREAIKHPLVHVHAVDVTARRGARAAGARAAGV